MKKYGCLPSLGLLLTFLFPLLVTGGTFPVKDVQKLKEPLFLQVLPIRENGLIALSPGNLYWVNETNETRRLFAVSQPHELKKIASKDNLLFLLSDKGIFLSDDSGKRWKEVSAYSRTQMGAPTCLVANRQTIYLGTEKGLYRSTCELSVIKKMDNFPNDEVPLEIKSVSENIFFVLTDRGLWKTLDGGLRFEKLLGNIPSQIEIERDAEEITPEENDPKIRGKFTALEIDPAGEKVWIGSEKGVLTSENSGLAFKKISSSGLTSDHMTQLLLTPAGLAGATTKGVYLFDKKQKLWRSLMQSLEAKPVYGLAASQDRIWIAAKDGIFSTSFPSPEFNQPQEFRFDPDRFKDLDHLIKSEPAVREVQKAAIQYSNTKNGKIRSWQILSRLRALAPTLSYDIGHSRSSSIDLDRGGTNDPDKYITGPESWGRDRDISVSWDLGDFLFSTSQTSIDSRDKLMVELRDEIVSEVTRLYFERRRLQIDILFERPEGKELFGLLLQIEELTAQIDGLTGGFFSKRLKPTKHSNLLLAVQNMQPVSRSPE